MKKVGIILICLCLTTSGIFAQFYQDTITQKLASLSVRSTIPGFSVALVEKNQILYQNAFGYADLDSKKPFSINTIQNIGSISKTFISVVLMKLVEEGKIGLDDPINQYLSFAVNHPKKRKRKITIRHLATHTSGLTDGKDEMLIEKSYLFTRKTNFKSEDLPEGYFEYFQIYDQNKPMPLKDFLYNMYCPIGDWYSSENFDKAPGKAYHYSNTGATLLAYILEKVSGESFVDLTQRIIFDPLEMHNSGWHLSSVDMANFASLYLSNGQEIPKYDLISYADGGLKTDMVDFSKYFMEMIRGLAGEGKILSKASYQEMMSNQLIKENFPKGKFENTKGFNWDVNDTGDNVSMNGSDPGIFTYCLFTTAGDLGVVIFMNTNWDDDEQKMEDFFTIRNTLLQHSGDLLKQFNQEQ